MILIISSLIVLAGIVGGDAGPWLAEAAGDGGWLAARSSIPMRIPMPV
jgi:hypothetical protein